MRSALGAFQLGTVQLAGLRVSYTIILPGLISPKALTGVDTVTTPTSRYGVSAPKSRTGLDSPTVRFGVSSPSEKAGKS